MSAEGNTPAEIMELLDELTPEPAAGGVYQTQAQRLQFCNGGMNGWWSVQIGGNRAWTAAARWDAAEAMLEIRHAEAVPAASGTRDFSADPLGRFQSSHSQMVRAISVTPNPAQSRAACRINA